MKKRPKRFLNVGVVIERCLSSGVLFAWFCVFVQYVFYLDDFDWMNLPALNPWQYILLGVVYLPCPIHMSEITLKLAFESRSKNAISYIHICKIVCLLMICIVNEFWVLWKIHSNYWLFSARLLQIFFFQFEVIPVFIFQNDNLSSWSKRLCSWFIQKKIDVFGMKFSLLFDYIVNRIQKFAIKIPENEINHN